ncbi:D-alanyl-D-alanine carboxypeptidase family protein [Ectobacillus ponti]|uniref:D-alanyl-D-alanine carboxypeptidase n=1 Tax=Ectobacillus ponti TaxID=2961894 RepID=A0AA41X776_9BACI|nr:D-alanyl-D-alanine carboxypeptidase [Ectobacillus ponti]MCP8968463.1 D-alanyl-D-alanine carboxypeptidase [Ectobacillus ponti]
MKRLRQWALAVLCLFVILPAQGVRAEGQPDVFGQYAVSINAQTGDVLYDKNAHHQAFPASITKILTAIVLMEHLKPADQIVFSQKALDEEKSNYQVEFAVGETMDRDTALMTLMVLSANDVAYAIAEKVAGSPEEFAKLMNAKAVELGAKDSHFIRPNGLHDPQHYTTPYDMAMIARGVLKYPEIMKAMSTKRTSIATSRQTASIFNKATFFENPECLGGKTGFTNQSRNTLVEIDKRGDAVIINVVMASQKPEIYNDMNIISNYAFPQLTKETVLDGAKWSQSIPFLDKRVAGKLEHSADVMVKQGEQGSLQSVVRPVHFHADRLYREGIREGEVIGQVDVVKNGAVLDSVNILAKERTTFQKPVAEKTGISLVSASITVITLLGGAGLGVAIQAMRRRRAA